MIDEGTTLMATSREQLKANALGSSQLNSISEIQAIEVKVIEVSNEAIAIADGNSSNRVALISKRRETLDACIEALNLRLSYFADQASEDLDFTIQQSKQTTQQTLLVSFIAAFLICIGLALFMADKLTKPIINLMKIADKVSLGQLQQEVPVSGNDEITDLGISFQRMINAFKMQQAMYAEDAEDGNYEPV